MTTNCWWLNGFCVCTCLSHTTVTTLSESVFQTVASTASRCGSELININNIKTAVKSVSNCSRLKYLRCAAPDTLLLFYQLWSCNQIMWRGYTGCSNSEWQRKKERLCVCLCAHVWVCLCVCASSFAPLYEYCVV